MTIIINNDVKDKYDKNPSGHLATVCSSLVTSEKFKSLN